MDTASLQGSELVCSVLAQLIGVNMMVAVSCISLRNALSVYHRGY